MKQDDFERLKAIFEKEGFDIIERGSGSTKYFFEVKKKDPWEGVEFVECVKDYICVYTVGKVYKITRKHAGENMGIADNGIETYLMGNTSFKPSTETAYVDQLKKEAFERFGEIKEGDRFKNNPSKGVDTFKINHGVGFRYGKEEDMLTFNGWPIYQQGKWAERVKERVEVEVRSDVIREKSIFLTAQFSKKAAYRLNELESFLSQQIEKYLNGEID